MSEFILSSLASALSAAKGAPGNEPWLTSELKRMLDFIPTIVFVAEDVACVSLHRNAAAEALLRAPQNADPSAMGLGTRSFEAFDADGVLLRADQWPVQRAARGEILADVQFELRFEGGANVFLQGAATPLRDDRGAIHGAIGAFTDISSWKKRELELRAEIEAGKARQDALLASEIRYRDLAKSSPVMLWAADAKGSAIAHNDKWLSYTGQTRAQALGGGWMAALHPDDLPRVSQRWLESVASGANFEAEHRIRQASDGAWRWHLAKAKLHRDNQGRPLVWYRICVDIEDRKQAEAARRESERLFQTIFENAAAGIAIARAVPDGVFLRANDRLCEMLGYGPGELAGLCFTEITHPDDAEASVEKVRAILAGEIATFTLEKRYLKRDGAFIWAKANISLVRDEDNKPTFFIGSIVDISDLKCAEQALRASEERFRVLVETNARIVFETDPSGELMRESPAWQAFTGQTPEDWSLEGWAEAVHPEDRHRTIAAWRASVEAGTPYRNETRFRRADGVSQWGSVTAAPIRGEDGQIVKWVGMISDITERKLAEEALRQSDARLRLALKGAGAGVWQWNLATGESIWSPETFALFELDPQLGAPRFEAWLTHLHPDDLESTRRTILDAIEKREPELRLQFRWILRSGDIRWIEALMSLECARDGTPLCMFGVDTDITERMRAGEALRRSEERLRFALKGARAGVWQWNITTREAIWSPEMFTMFERDPQLGAPGYEGWLTYLHPDDLEPTERANREIMENGQSEHSKQYRVVLPSGGVRWIESLESTEFATDGTPLRMHGINRDITERKVAEQQLAESEARFRAAQESSLDGFIIYAPIKDENSRITDLKVVYINPIAAKYCHHTPEEMAGRRIGDLLPGTSTPGGLIERVSRIVESGNSEEFLLEYAGDGILGCFRNLVVPFGRHVAVTIRDDTELLRGATALGVAKSEAERANLAKSKFLAAASHDLRQPVQSLIMLMAAIKRQVADRPKIAQAVMLAESSIKSLNEMLTGFLDISRLDAGVIQPVMASVDVSAMVSRLAAEYQARAAADGLALRCRPRDFLARTDAALLERILRNLIENALRYTVKGGVLIGLRQRGDKVRLDVIDTGIGIPVDKQVEIFEEFRQLDNPARDANRGLGLGLAIVSRLGRLVGAEVQVHSRPGRGARFSLLLPQERTAPVAAFSRPAVENPGGRILVIEDVATLRLAYEMMLGFSGYEVLSADTGEEALALAAREGWRFDAILADHRLGAGLTGTATAMEISRQAGRAIPTMIVTGDTSRKRLAEVSASGFAMLHKPVDADELCGTASLLSGGSSLPPVTGED